MLQGDLATMPLADLLQWVDAANVTGTLTVEQGGASVRVQVEHRFVTRISPPPDFTLNKGQPDLDTRQAVEVARSIAEDRLLDLFLAPDGLFHLTEAERVDDDIDVNVAMRVLVMEGLRCLDEWPRLQQTFPLEAAMLAATGATPPRELSSIQDRVLACAVAGMSLADARMRLGLSRPALLRRLEQLRAMGLVTVDGARQGVDPVAHLISQANVLVAERQFEEAGIVFTSLLTADPTDARVRRLLQEAEREHVAAIYQELDPLAVPRVVDPAALSARRLSRSDKEVMDRINGRWDVASVVLASPLREVETLKGLRRLSRQGLVEMAKDPGRGHP